MFFFSDGKRSIVRLFKDKSMKWAVGTNGLNGRAFPLICFPFFFVSFLQVFNDEERGKDSSLIWTLCFVLLIASVPSAHCL